jgi:hypothetical protein
MRLFIFHATKMFPERGFGTLLGFFVYDLFLRKRDYTGYHDYGTITRLSLQQLHAYKIKVGLAGHSSPR